MLFEVGVQTQYQVQKSVDFFDFSVVAIIIIVPSLKSNHNVKQLHVDDSFLLFR